MTEEAPVKSAALPGSASARRGTDPTSSNDITGDDISTRQGEP
jgi:hypothetical protein